MHFLCTHHTSVFNVHCNYDWLTCVEGDLSTRVHLKQSGVINWSWWLYVCGNRYMEEWERETETDRERERERERETAGRRMRDLVFHSVRSPAIVLATDVRARMVWVQSCDQTESGGHTHTHTHRFSFCGICTVCVCSSHSHERGHWVTLTCWMVCVSSFLRLFRLCRKACTTAEHAYNTCMYTMYM